MRLGVMAGYSGRTIDLPMDCRGVWLRCGDTAGMDWGANQKH
jgi:hypothetical protein